MNVNCGFWVEDEEKRVATKAIEKVKEIYLSQKDKVEREKYLLDLVILDYAATIRSNKTVWDYREASFKSAQHQEKEKYKKDREQFEYIKSSVIDTFFNGNKEVKITHLISGGYEGYYWQVQGSFKGVEFAVQIPIRAKITAHNMGDASYGKFIFLVKTGSCCWTHMAYSYEEEDITKFIREYFELDKAEEKDNG